MATRRPVIFVLGPTGAGKSAHALRWAKETQGDIVNCDSLQVYRNLNIGTAKPTAQEMSDVPHHLFGIVPVGVSFNAGDFRRAALECLEKLQQEGDRGPIFVVGGSGFYVQALIHGMFESPAAAPKIQQALKLRMETEGPIVMHQELSLKDPAAAVAIHVNDRYRIQRALEILASTGLRPSEIRNQFQDKPRQDSAFPYPFAQLGTACAREVLLTRIKSRTARMLALGLVAEVQELRARGWGAWPPLQSVGYKETQNFLDGSLELAQLVPLITTHTMQLAKRQMTWFRRDSTIRWFDTTTSLSWTQAFAMLELS